MSIESGMMYPAPNTRNTKSNHVPWPDNSCDNGISSAEKGYDVIVWQGIGPILRLLWIYLCGMADVHTQHGGAQSPVKYRILVVALLFLVYVMLFSINGEIPIVVNRT
jgi:hypothetical protein